MMAAKASLSALPSRTFLNTKNLCKRRNKTMTLIWKRVTTSMMIMVRTELSQQARSMPKWILLSCKNKRRSGKSLRTSRTQTMKNFILG